MKRLTFAGTSKLVASSAFAVILLAGTTACSSSDSSGSGGSGSAVSAGSGAALAAKVAKDKEGVPAEFGGPTEPVTVKAGVKLAVIPCSASLTGCQIPIDGAVDAAKKIGWDVKQFDGKGNPRSENEAILQAVSWGADAIITQSIDAQLVQQGMRAAHDAGIVLISTASATHSPNPIVKPQPGAVGYDVDVSPDFVGMGASLADWVVNDSKHKADVVVVADDEFGSVTTLQTSFKKQLANCASCKLVDTIQITADQVGPQVAQTVTSFMQTHPEVDYVLTPYDPVAAVVVPAFGQAGMSKVKVLSAGGAPENLAYIKEGRVQVADMANDYHYFGWGAVDQAVRKLAGKDFSEPNGEGVPWILIDKSNVPSNSDGLYHPSYDYQAAYLKLWGK